MLHAVIRNQNDTLHFFAELDPYSLQTLQEHVRAVPPEYRPIHLTIELAAGERRDFERSTRRWVSRLARAGNTVVIGTEGTSGVEVRHAV